MKNSRGYTLIELVVALGLFALVMTLVSGAYIMMIGITRQVQGTATGIDNLSFAMETMVRTIRTGTQYGCPTAGIDCEYGGGKFLVTDMYSRRITYELLSGTITKNGAAITDSNSVNITDLKFYVSGTKPYSDGNNTVQPHVTIVVSGTVSAGAGKPSQSFTIETGATMRSIDL